MWCVLCVVITAHIICHLYFYQQLTKEVIDEKRSVNKNKASTSVSGLLRCLYIYSVLTLFIFIISPQSDKVDKMLKANELSEMRRMNEIEQRLATATTNREQNLIAKSSASKKRILTPRGSPTSKTQIEEKASVALCWVVCVLVSLTLIPISSILHTTSSNANNHRLIQLGHVVRFTSQARLRRQKIHELLLPRRLTRNSLLPLLPSRLVKMIHLLQDFLLVSRLLV